MSGRRNGLLQVLLLLPLLVSGCGDERQQDPAGVTGPVVLQMEQMEPLAVDSTLEDALRTDPDVRALITIRNELTFRAARLRIRGVEAKAMLARDPSGERLASRLGFSKAEISALDQRVRVARENLILRYPELSRLMETLPSCPREPEPLFNFLDKLTPLQTASLLPAFGFLSPARIGPFGFQEEPPVEDPCEGIEDEEERVECYEQFADGEGGNCAWGLFTACLVVCTTAGPVLYWPCAWLCICGFCEGTILDQLLCETS